MQKSVIPNVLTCIRIAGAAALAFVVPLTLPFYILYIACGLTDVLDGTIARATNSQSATGAVLDSVADLLFYAVVLLRLVPVFWKVVARPVWYAAFTVVALRAMSYAIAALRFHRFASLHTYANKLTSAAVFCIPLLFQKLPANAVCSVTCAIAAFAAVEELLIHLTSPTYLPERKTLFPLPDRNANAE